MHFTRILMCVAESTKKYSNLPEAYIKRAMDQVEWKTPKGRKYRQVEIKRRRFLHGVQRPWTEGFQMENPPNTLSKQVYLEPIIDWPFFRGDQVQILDGEDKGKKGIINYMVEERNWVIVEGLNCDYKTVGQTKGFPGAMIKEEQPLVINSQVKLIDPSDEQPTEVEWRYTEEGTRVRVSRRTGRIIPIPVMAQETYDYKSKALYVENPEKDTRAVQVNEETYTPSLKTFAMDICEKAGIKDDRIPQKTYWYYIDP